MRRPEAQQQGRAPRLRHARRRPRQAPRGVTVSADRPGGRAAPRARLGGPLLESGNWAREGGNAAGPANPDACYALALRARRGTHGGGGGDDDGSGGVPAKSRPTQPATQKACRHPVGVYHPARELPFRSGVLTVAAALRGTRRPRCAGQDMRDKTAALRVYVVRDGGRLPGALTARIAHRQAP